MARIKKCREVCFVPRCSQFSPPHPQGSIRLSVEELEALRLSDLEGLDQQLAAAQMGVSRGTYQRVLTAARRQVVEAVVGGKALLIGGGSYRLRCRALEGQPHPCCQLCGKTAKEDGEE